MIEDQSASSPTIGDDPALPASYRAGWISTSGFAALWSVGFSVVGIGQFFRFHVHAFDLGIFTQGTYLLSQLKEPFVTVRGLHLFADHSSYILILIAPLYAVLPSAVTLIVVTIGALAASSLLAFAIAKNAGAGQWLAFTTAALVLISPAVQWQIRDTFHPEVLVIPLMLLAVVLLQKDRDALAFAAVVVALTAKEDVALIVVPFGLAVWWLMAKRRTGLVLAATGVFAFLLNFLVLLPAWSPTGELLYSYRYTHLGETPLGIVVGLLTSPDVWFDTLTDPTRIWYVAGLVLAMPLALLAWRWLLVGIPALLANVFSTHGYQYEIEWHYTAYLIVVVVIAGAYGADQFKRIRGRNLRSATIVASLLVVAGVWFAAAPVAVWAKPHDHHARIEAMLDIIPPHDSVSAWTTLVPHLANREQVYLFPNPFEEYYYGIDGPEGEGPVEIEWVALRLDSYRDFDRVFQRLVESGAYTIYYEDHPFRLLRRAP